jgi:hypothetical protein
MGWSGLVSAVIAGASGGALALATALLVERRRNRTAIDAEQRVLRRQAVGAMRLVRAELIDAMTEIENAIDARALPAKLPSMASWPAVATILAETLPKNAWFQVSISVGRVEEVKRYREPDCWLSHAPWDIAEDNLTDATEQLDNTQRLLLRLAGDELTAAEIAAARTGMASKGH